MKSPKQISNEVVAGLRAELEERELLLNLSKKIAHVRAKSELNRLIREQFSQLFYFFHCTIIVVNDDKRTYRAFMLDPESKVKIHEKYRHLISNTYEINNGIDDVILASEKPLIFYFDEINARGQLPIQGQIIHESGIVEALAAKLVREQESFASLYFYSDIKYKFTAREVAIVETIATVIAPVVANILADEKIAAKTKERDALLTVSNAISSVKNRLDLLDIINNQLKQLLSFRHSLVLKFDEDFNLKAFLLDPNSKSRSYPKYNSIVNNGVTSDDRIIQTLLLSAGPVIFNIEEEALKPDARDYIKMHQQTGLREMMAVILRKPDQQPMGVLSLYSDQYDCFQQDKIDLFESIAFHFGTAMSNILYHEELLEREQDTQLLLSLSAGVARVRNRQDLVKVITNKLKKILRFSDLAITRYFPEDATYEVFAHDLQSEKLNDPEFLKIASQRAPIVDGIHDRALAADGPVIISIDEAKDHPENHACTNFIQKFDLRCMLLIKLTNNDEVIGFLNIFSEEDDALTAISFTILKGIADQLSIAIANIISLEEIKRREVEKSLLLNFSSDVNAVKGKGDLAAIIEQRLPAIVPYEEVVICLLTENDLFHYPYLHVTGHSLEHGKIQVGNDSRSIASFPVEDGLFAQILSSGIPTILDLENLNVENGYPEYIKERYDLGIREIVAVPMRVGNKDLGAFFIMRNSVSVWNDGELRLLSGVCHQLSTAVSNLQATMQIEDQLLQINNYKEQLEEEKLYLQKEVSGDYTYSDMIGSGKEMQKVFTLLSQVSFASSTVLILGETGTGKELIARAIHSRSPRKDKLMVKVNCAALPANLIESELFGHEKGSFTGATDKRIGKFELANHGTLFLDEIGEMPLDLQVKLLRALQEKEIERVGGRGPIKIDVRIIAATNRNLQREVDNGNFRSDLFYRLNVFPITLPPLRERKDDIPVLAAHFIAKYAKSTGRKIGNISVKAMEDLMDYSWPGNVRELEHLIERSVLMSSGNTIKEMHLPSRQIDQSQNKQGEEQLKTYEENERDHIIRILSFCKGKVFGKGGAAELLDLNVATLNSKIKKLGIEKGTTFSTRAE